MGVNHLKGRESDLNKINMKKIETKHTKTNKRMINIIVCHLNLNTQTPHNPKKMKCVMKERKNVQIN